MAERQVTGRPRRGERRLITRAQLLDAAERVFARDGLRGASVDKIALEAGYSTGAVYSNFKGKEDLFLTLIEERVDVIPRHHSFDGLPGEIRVGVSRLIEMEAAFEELVARPSRLPEHRKLNPGIGLASHVEVHRRFAALHPAR